MSIPSRLRPAHSVRTALGTLVMSTLLGLGFANTALADETAPKDAFNRYHQTLINAQEVDAILPYMCKRATDEINRTPKEMKPMMFDLMKSLVPKKVSVTSETIDGDHAVLKLANSGPPPAAGENSSGESSNEKTEGTITLVRENGEWKIDKENWKSSETITGP